MLRLVLIPLLGMLVCAAYAQEPLNILTLPISQSDRPENQVKGRIGDLLDLRTGRTITFAKIIDAMRGAQFVFVGESHTTPAHHQLQADIIEALAHEGRQVFVGMEMFERPVQDELFLWTMGMEDEPTFIERVQWYFNWGFNYALYKPIFDVVRANRIPLIALNAPRALVSKVGRVGPEGLTPEDRAAIPALDLTVVKHRLVFETMIGGTHGGASADKMYAAQVLWDTYMADSAIRYWRQAPRASNAVFVILAGSGHVLYKQGINYRLAERLHPTMVTVVGLEADKADDPLTIGRGIADFALVTPPHEEPYPSFGASVESSPEGGLRVRAAPFAREGIVLDLEKGDRILSVDDRTFTDPHRLLVYLAGKRFGDTITVEIERDGKRQTLTRTISR